MSCPLATTSQTAGITEQKLLACAHGSPFNNPYRITDLQVQAGNLIVNCLLSISYQSPADIIDIYRKKAS